MILRVYVSFFYESNRSLIIDIEIIKINYHLNFINDEKNYELKQRP